jgi:hypothetical protein
MDTGIRIACMHVINFTHMIVHMICMFKMQHNVANPVDHMCRVHMGPPWHAVSFAFQQCFLYDMDDDQCPHWAFLEDMKAEVAGWIKEGDQVLVMLDGNEDVQGTGISKVFEEVGLREVILERHGVVDAPLTYNQGPVPIDGIWASLTLGGVKAGYVAFGSAVLSDHRCLWVNISFQDAFGHVMPPIATAHMHCLKCCDHCVVKKYIEV